MSIVEEYLGWTITVHLNGIQEIRYKGQFSFIFEGGIYYDLDRKTFFQPYIVDSNDIDLRFGVVDGARRSVNHLINITPNGIKRTYIP